MDAPMLNKQVVSYTLSSANDNDPLTIDLINPVRNVLAVKLLKVYAEINSSTALKGKQYLIDINDFNVASVYNGSGHLTDCFSILTADINDKTSGGNLLINYDSYTNTMFREDPQTFSANPIIPILNRFKLGIRDSETGIDVPINDVKQFHIQLCIYSQFAKLTMF